MALNKEIWQNTIIENFYPDNSFVAKSVNDSAFVEMRKVHIPNAGKASKVKTNRTQKPATVNERTDKDLEYEMDELTTDPIYIPHIDTVELSYDKRNSVLSNDRSQLQEEAAVNILHRWANIGVGKVIQTTGKEVDAYGGTIVTGQRKTICKKDVLKLMTAMNADNVPSIGRFLLLDAFMYADLLEDLSESDKWMFQNSANVQTGILGNLYGFNIMMRSSVLRLKADKSLLKAEDADEADQLAAALCWQENSVSHALGEVKMFSKTDDPTYYGDIYSFLLRTGGAVRRADKKGIFILSQAAV